MSVGNKNLNTIEYIYIYRVISSINAINRLESYEST